MRSIAPAAALVLAACGGSSASPVAPAAPVAPTASAGLAPTAPAASASPVVSARPTASEAPASRPPAVADGRPHGCAAGEIADCDALFERWSSRELLPKGREASARQDAEALRAGCDAHQVGAACMGYALMLKYGTATGARDNDASKPYFAKLRPLGDLNGFRGVPASKEGEAARKRAESECEAGRARSCAQAGWAAYEGVQRGKALADALRFYERACELGLGTGCRWAGHFAVTYPELGATSRGRALFKKGCDTLKHPGACDELGAYEASLKADLSVAVALWTRACDDGSRSACFHAGHALLDKGRDAEAKRLLELACGAGEDGACKALSRGGSPKLSTPRVTASVTAFLGIRRPRGASADR
ncbi:MAG: sel1 repeat family protein [Polyangiaceae bacterium]|nr:sel1 repeat family protein [Polyangiaceae bacterium]